MQSIQRWILPTFLVTCFYTLRKVTIVCHFLSSERTAEAVEVPSRLIHERAQVTARDTADRADSESQEIRILRSNDVPHALPGGSRVSRHLDMRAPAHGE